MDNLSKMLGRASVAMTERFYAPWVPAHHDQLRRAYLKTRLTADMSPNVIPFKKTGS